MKPLFCPKHMEDLLGFEGQMKESEISDKLQMLPFEKIKLSRLLVQHINEFKMNEIQRETPQ